MAVAGLVLSLVLAACATPAAGKAFDSIYAHAEGIGTDELENRQARDTAIVDWAVELGLDEQFSYSELERSHAIEMAARQAGTATGSGSYGAREMTLWDFYIERVEGDAQLIKSSLREELSMEQVRAYYEQHQDEFSLQDLITVRVTEWEDGRAVSSADVAIDATNVRMLQEGDDAMISAALVLDEGERTTVERLNGTFAQLECLSRADGGTEAFDAVVQAAASQLASQRFNGEVQRRMGGSS